jgi:hypothetical protein
MQFGVQTHIKKTLIAIRSFFQNQNITPRAFCRANLLKTKTNTDLLPRHIETRKNNETVEKFLRRMKGKRDVHMQQAIR